MYHDPLRMLTRSRVYHTERNPNNLLYDNGYFYHNDFGSSSGVYANTSLDATQLHPQCLESSRNALLHIKLCGSAGMLSVSTEEVVRKFFTLPAELAD